MDAFEFGQTENDIVTAQATTRCYPAGWDMDNPEVMPFNDKFLCQGQFYGKFPTCMMFENILGKIATY